MPNALNSYGDYAKFIFFLLAKRPAIERHNLAVYTKNQTIGITRGRIYFRSGHVLRAYEQIDFVADCIVRYFYELTFENEPLWWYDSMPHPGVQQLQSTHPHHKHIPPDIKHHRVAAEEISFTRPNLPVFLVEIENLIEKKTDPYRGMGLRDERMLKHPMVCC